MEDFSSHAILLYGPRKSGSSLLHNLLDGGSKLLMLPGELKIKPLVQKERWKKTLVEHYVQRGRLDFHGLYEGSVFEPETLRARPDYHFEGLTIEQTEQLFDVPFYVERLKGMLLDPPEDYPSIVQRDVQAFREALKADSKNFTCWAAKEVGGNTEELIPFFKKIFPRGKVVYIARDPKFVVRSIVMDRRRKGIYLGFRQIWEECVSAQTVLNFIHNDGISNDVVVIYEKLTENIEAEMQRLTNLLDIPFEPILCQPTTLGQPVVVRTSSQKTTEVFRPAPDWKKDLTPTQINAIRLFHGVKPLRYGRGGKKYVSYEELLRRYEQHEQKNK